MRSYKMSPLGVTPFRYYVISITEVETSSFITNLILLEDEFFSLWSEGELFVYIRRVIYIYSSSLTVSWNYNAKNSVIRTANVKANLIIVVSYLHNEKAC